MRMMRSTGRRAVGEVDSVYAWLRLLAGVLTSTIGGVGMWSIAVVLPTLQADFGVTRADVSLAYTAVMLGAVVGGPVMGWLSDRFGITVPVAIGTATLALAGVFFSQSGALSPAASAGRPARPYTRLMRRRRRGARRLSARQADRPHCGRRASPQAPRRRATKLLTSSCFGVSLLYQKGRDSRAISRILTASKRSGSGVPTGPHNGRARFPRGACGRIVTKV
jgi:hypothetical protein